eukprot:14262439-Ditylum_brightwellii.AAC.1
MLVIATEWDTPVVAPRSSKPIMNIFDKKDVNKDTSKRHIDLVWVNTGHKDTANETPTYFKVITPANATALNSKQESEEVEACHVGNHDLE